MSSITIDTKRAIAKVYKSAIAATAIPTTWEVGLLDALQDQKKVNVAKFAAEHNLDSDSMQGVAVALAVVDVVKCDQDNVTAGRLFDVAYLSLAYARVGPTVLAHAVFGAKGEPHGCDCQ